MSVALTCAGARGGKGGAVMKGALSSPGNPATTAKARMQNDDLMKASTLLNYFVDAWPANSTRRASRVDLVWSGDLRRWIEAGAQKSKDDENCVRAKAPCPRATTLGRAVGLIQCHLCQQAGN